MNDITALAHRAERIISEMKLSHGDKDIYAPVMKWDEFLALVEALEKAQRKIAQVTAERDALREGEMGNAKHSNTRAAADIYFQLVEECDIPAGGSLVEFVDELKERVRGGESRAVTVKLPEVERPIDGTGYAHAAGAQLYREQVIKSLAAAGIQVIEGEGQ